MVAAVLELFTCPEHPGGLRLTPSACASQFQRAKGANPWDSVYRCHGCEIGAANAGCPPPPPAPGRTLCCRCGRTGLRLIRGQICVSCYNREREVRIGKDRRGNAPKSAPPSFSLALSLGTGAFFQAVATNRIELAVFAARKFPGATMARYFTAPQSDQPRLFAGFSARTPAKRILRAKRDQNWAPIPVVRPSLPTKESLLPRQGSVLSWPIPLLYAPNHSLSFWGGL